RADVVALPVAGGGIVDRKEYAQEVAERQHGRIEADSDDFGVPRCAAADGLVAGVGASAPGITRFDRLHAGELVEYCLEAPEAPAAQYGGLRRFGHRCHGQ